MRRSRGSAGFLRQQGDCRLHFCFNRVHFTARTVTERLELLPDQREGACTGSISCMVMRWVLVLPDLAGDVTSHRSRLSGLTGLSGPSLSYVTQGDAASHHHTTD